MLRYFDMMYYHLATFYQRFHDKRSGWQIQAAFVIGITQLVLLLDVWMIITFSLGIKGKISIYETISFSLIALFLVFYNIKRYEKNYRYYKSIWGVHKSNTKKFHKFLTFFTAIFAWIFILIIGFIFKKY
ncbi:hypothetical protein N6B72_12095 [Chryseobacterium soli]|uniref:hypothetical protein n=1 Tax=Chryseobacterium soli TaxID=445961 RepID=UPI0029559300|nr:hypothetical protein [Chryseobacterium soli]MDV7697662.1 hypothetical protein [Chryseobacterium soli]